ncbi:PREDICTED: gamma-glutamyltranspeptidase 1 [Rhagoletis zephyria]|uniref:gamma-glutamyltranspeptidase 1 n=2 Tax=Rhagoletis TaxID=28609 RepID=UPI0008112ECD|nr:PREDICTED: gamma-glutamyltranspeptidase 1 [Rhagoletis zephyria]
MCRSATFYVSRTPWRNFEAIQTKSPLLTDGKDRSDWCRKYVIIWIILSIAIIGITLSLIFGLRSKQYEPLKLGYGAVVSNGDGCAVIGGKMLSDGGSAVDAAIATLLCEGVMLPHSMGVGGGFVATIYSKDTSKIETLIARETAPASSVQNMFIDKQITGAIAAAVPSEIYGYWRLHEKYGKLPWKSLFEPTIELCFKGIKVSKYLANVLNLYADRILNEPSMAEIFINPETKELYKEDEIMYRRKLGETLKIVAEEGPEAIYRGGIIGKKLVEDIQEMDGIITEADLQNYEVRWEDSVKVNFEQGYTLYTTPLPTSGAVLAFILKVMEPMYAENETVFWHRLVETFKHAYGHRTSLGDIHYEPGVAETYKNLLSTSFAAETRKLISDDRTYTDFGYYGANFTNENDKGTANIAVLAPNGDAIAVTSTVNSHFGSKVRSRQTGIILNDEMDDFSTPGVINAYGIPSSPSNYIKPGKRPMSSTCPSIVLDHSGNVKLMVGGAGGSRITTSVAQTILRYFMLNNTIQESIDAGRVHHQLAPMQVDVEAEVPEHINSYLLKVGHELNYLPGDKAYSALTAIGLKTNEPQPACDRRRVGSWKVVYSGV